jgi:phosphatidylserine/phosphatidylglycerophosphate/cardiolipin synthase-like enzyme
VAFWGEGAQHLIDDAKPHLIVLNLRSGGTNPDVVRAIHGMRGVTVRQLDTLHAKVVIADSGAIVSSANFSTNGLALDGHGILTWQEAGVYMPADAADFDALGDWFDKLWSRSSVILEADLVAAGRAWQAQSLLGPGH